MINGYTSINLTKLDVLDQLEEIQIGVAYLVGGEELDCAFPADLDYLEKVEVKYVTVKGWKQSIEKCTTWDELPSECKEYVKMIENLMQVPIKWIGGK
jgi:adenylosuccinate synthase